MNTCDTCFREADDLHPFQGDQECGECRDYREYYDSLTPAQLREEHEAMARYAEEMERLGL